jgi:hypothetical protein
MAALLGSERWSKCGRGPGTITTLASFNGTNGQYPEGGLVGRTAAATFSARPLGATHRTPARCSKCRRAAGPLPHWLRSTAPTGNTPQAAWSRTDPQDPSRIRRIHHHRPTVRHRRLPGSSVLHFAQQASPGGSPRGQNCPKILHTDLLTRYTPQL